MRIALAHRWRPALILTAVFAGFGAQAQTPAASPSLSPSLPASLAQTYKPQADRLIAAALADDEGYADLTYLCDRIGQRVSGSESLDRAIAWSADLMRRKGLVNVTLQPVMVPHWVRGAESAAIVEPAALARPLRMLGLGMSPGTPAGGLTADIVVVNSLAQMKALDRTQVEGRIMVFNVPFETYGKTAGVRFSGPSQAAALGAVGALVRSITPLAAQLPHTGATGYDEKHPKIPAAAITPEDAMLLGRLATQGKAENQPVRIKLQMQARTLPDAKSANVLGEIVGREKPEEVVVLGGHIDSWDVGQGAQDDGSGMIATLQAVALIKKLGLQPRRTIRVVFWTNEENGGKGGAAYRRALGDKVNDHVAAIEMDGGAEAPLGYGYGTRPPGATDESAASTDANVLPGERRSFELLRQIAGLLKPVGADTIRAGGFGADIGPLMRDGVPGLGTVTTMAHYFDWHHTEADTIDKVDPQHFRQNIASLAVMAFVLADMPERLVGRVAGK